MNAHDEKLVLVEYKQVNDEHWAKHFSYEYLNAVLS